MTNVTQNIEFVFQRVENMCEKRENDGYQHFLPFQPCFQTAFSTGLINLHSQSNTITSHSYIQSTPVVSNFVNVEKQITDKMFILCIVISNVIYSIFNIIKDRYSCTVNNRKNYYITYSHLKFG